MLLESHSTLRNVLTSLLGFLDHIKVHAITGNGKYSGAGNGILISFYIEGEWSNEQIFSQSLIRNEETSTDFVLSGVPAKLKFRDVTFVC